MSEIGEDWCQDRVKIDWGIVNSQLECLRLLCFRLLLLARQL